MDWAVHLYLEERGFEGEPEAYQLHAGPGGWSSSEAMAYAFRTTGMAQYGQDILDVELLDALTLESTGP
eukprot:12579192-Prorocentrum_lima.AAC.1